MASFSVIVFGVVDGVDDSRIQSKTAPFSFENGLVWTAPKPFVTWRSRSCRRLGLLKLPIV